MIVGKLFAKAAFCEQIENKLLTSVFISPLKLNGKCLIKINVKLRLELLKLRLELKLFDLL